MWNATFDSWQIIWWANDGVASWARTYVAVAAHSAVARAVQAAAPNWRQQWVYVRMHANPARSMGVPRLHITELLHCGWPLAKATPSTSHYCWSDTEWLPSTSAACPAQQLLLSVPPSSSIMRHTCKVSRKTGDTVTSESLILRSGLDIGISSKVIKPQLKYVSVDWCRQLVL